jgi:threonine dehydratase
VAEVDQVAAALRLMAERNRIIAEGAGAAPVACVLDRPKAKIVCVVSGGNIDLSKLAEIFGTN